MTHTQSTNLTIGRLAKNAGVGIDTIRFYERRGLLPSPARSAAGYRLYHGDTIARIRFIRRAKQLGFTLDEIQNLLRLQDQGGKKSAVRKLTETKLQQINEKIDDLQRIRTVLIELSGQCKGNGNVDSCPIIEAISGNEGSQL
jgi:MerR family copper efflux transcriptional regulator